MLESASRGGAWSGGGVPGRGGVCSGGFGLGGGVPGPGGGGGVSGLGGGLLQGGGSASVPCGIPPPPPCEQNDKQVQKYYLSHNFVPADNKRIQRVECGELSHSWFQSHER